ncbi:glycosyltransferase family 2 protein [Tenacibaculum sp. TC6]|uniref:glycosyltransferase family 2 protein n=1 Tax=Tenacibaculum sp. TC6 TaxID=3423223 RepID=UPI003D3652F8
MTQLSVIIPTFNEESNIRRALDSVFFADEIIVIDSFSTDATVAIVKEYDVRLLQRNFDNFSSQKNYALQYATNKWILFLDADEQVTNELRVEIQKTISNESLYSAYRINRTFYFKNKKISYSGFRNGSVIRLLIKNSCKYVGKVHEKIDILPTNVENLKGRINHFSYKSYFQYENKLKKYAILQSQELYAKGKQPTVYHFFIKPLIRFFIHYIIKLGFLDGKKGFILSFLHAKGVYFRYKELEVLNTKKN